MARTPESAAVDFAESSLFTGRFSILALAACGVGFSLLRLLHWYTMYLLC